MSTSSKLPFTSLVLVVSIALSASSTVVGCKKKSDAPANPEIASTDNGKSAEELGKAIYGALQAGDSSALLKLTAPGSLAKCERSSAAQFTEGWKKKKHGALQSVGAISDVEKVAAGGKHSHSKCTAGSTNMTFGQILVFTAPGAPDGVKTTLFSPFWIAKKGDDPSPNDGWYLVDELGYLF